MVFNFQTAGEEIKSLLKEINNQTEDNLFLSKKEAISLLNISIALLHN
jgi:hypothetical protein